MNEALVSLLQNYPWAVYVWLGATVLAVGLRAAWPSETERPRWLVMVLAIVDIVQMNWSGPAKLLVLKAKAPD